MATPQQQDQVATAAKVIRIVHNNHTAASDYLHGLHVTSGETLTDSKDQLLCMDTDEYTDLIGDLDQSQKTAFFGKVARLNEKPSYIAAGLDKSTFNKYFDALALNSKGLKSKEVRKQIKKGSQSVDTGAAPTTRAAPPSKPGEENLPKDGERNNKSVRKDVHKPSPPTQKASATPALTPKKKEKSKKRKREENTPKPKPSRPEPATTDGAKRPAKKQKTVSAQPLSAEDHGGLTRNQRKRKKWRELMRTIRANGSSNEQSSKHGVLVEMEPSRLQETATNDKDDKPEPVDVVMAQAPASENVPSIEGTPVPERKKKRVRRSQPRSRAAATKLAEPETSDVSAPQITAQSEDAQPEGNKQGRRNHKKPKAAEQSLLEPTPADQESSDDEKSTNNEEKSVNNNGLPSFIMRTSLPVKGKPTISATADPAVEGDKALQSTTELAQPEEIASSGTSEGDAEPLTEETAKRQPSPELGSEDSAPPAVQEEAASSPRLNKTSIEKEAEPFEPPPALKTDIPKPNLLQRSKPLSAFNLSHSSAGTPKHIPPAVSKAPDAAFREFNRFINNNDSSDDESDSSSSSSDSDGEQPPPQALLPVTAVVDSKVQESKEINSPPDADGLTAEPANESEAEPSAMDVDMDATAMDEPADVMTNGHEHSSEKGENQPSTHDKDEDLLAKTYEADPGSFQTFHKRNSLGEIVKANAPQEIPDPDYLMEFGGYRPQASQEDNPHSSPAEVEEAEQHYNREPANRDEHEHAELTDSSNSIEMNERSETENQEPKELLEASQDTKAVLEDEPQNNQDANAERTEQETTTNDEPKDVEMKDEQVEDSVRPSSPTSEFSEDVQSQAFRDSIADFLQAWEEEQDKIEARLADSRERLKNEGDGGAESNMVMLEKLMDQVNTEEEIYKSKTIAARKAVGVVPSLARKSMVRVVDHAETTFDQRVLHIRAALREEHNAESARAQLSSSKEGRNGSVNGEVESSSDAASNATDDWAPTEDEGLTESAKQRKKRKTTGATSKHFATPSPKKKRVPAGTSAVPFPKLSAARFGLVQERLCKDPFRLLVAVTFLNKTTGRAAMPIFEKVMEEYPTPSDLAAADVKDLSEMIHSLGFQNQRAKKLIKIAETWVAQPPQKGILFRTKDYPLKGDGRDLGPKDIVEEDVEQCSGALEIAHIYGLGPYAWDSWRIFCRDMLRGVAEGYNGEGVEGYDPSSQKANFEPEWKRVVPLDKELRACLRWMWLREGWEWNPLTGNKKRASAELMARANEGIATWDEPVVPNPHGEETNTQQAAEELEGPDGPDALTPGIKAKIVTPRTTRSRKVEPVVKITPAVTRSQKRPAVAPEIMTSRLRPRRGRDDGCAEVPATPSRSLRARK